MVDFSVILSYRLLLHLRIVNNKKRINECFFMEKDQRNCVVVMVGLSLLEKSISRL